MLCCQWYDDKSTVTAAVRQEVKVWEVYAIDYFQILPTFLSEPWLTLQYPNNTSVASGEDVFVVIAAIQLALGNDADDDDDGDGEDDDDDDDEHDDRRLPW